MATPQPGKIVPHEDVYFGSGNGLVYKRRTWMNDNSGGPIGISPFQQDKDYFVTRKRPVFTDASGKTVYANTTPVKVKGSELVSPAGSPNHAPPERQEVVPITQGEEMLEVYEAEVPADPPPIPA